MRRLAMISGLFALFGLMLLALATRFGAMAIERAYPPTGVPVAVAGGNLHVLDLGPKDASVPPVVLIHGASGNLNEMRLALGDRLAATRRVILIDRPGHGWSERTDAADIASPSAQARLIGQALDRLGVVRPILVAHSWAGALAAAYALERPDAVTGLVLVAPVTHPWPGGISWYYTLASTPVVGRLFVNTIALPGGLMALRGGIASVFAPQAVPADYMEKAAIPLVLRPSAFADNAADVAALHDQVVRQAPRYGALDLPVSIIAGTRDTIVSTDIHARAFARAVPQTNLVVLEDFGHAPHHIVPDVVIREIDRVGVALASAR
jgi:pimeloyl-ACP methyl ester carboxylesterase